MPITSGITLPAIHPFLGADTGWLLRHAAAAHGDRRFLTWEPYDAPARHWRYGEALAAIRRIAAGLAARGVGAGDAVLLHLENSPESVLAWLACGEIGAVAVTTNARCAGDELAYFAERTQAVGIVTQPGFAALADAALPAIGWRAIVPPGEGETVLGADPAALPARTPDPAAPFGVQFTSGTTARPKGVVWTHANALWGAMVGARHVGVRASDVALIANPLFHTMAQSWQLLASIWMGARVVVVPRPSGEHFWDVVVRNGVTWCSGGTVTRQAVAGQPVPAHRLRFLVNVVNEAPSAANWGLRTFAGFGMTELVTQVILSDPEGPLDDGTLGRPAPEYAIAIRRPDGGDCAAGEPGELHVRGVPGLSMFARYLDDGGGTAATLTADGFFRTGDVVVARPDGALAFVDRLKDMLRVGGENVAASEIETVAMRVPGVREVAVVAGPHPRLDEVPVAFVIPAAGAPADLAERVTAACAAALAGFKVPRTVRLVGELPRSMGAKVAKGRLRALLAAERA